MNLQMSVNVSGGELGVNTQLNGGGGSLCDCELIHPDCMCVYVSYTPVTKIFGR